MTLPASGPLAMTDIQTEFGGTNPIGLNEYYAGGGLVPAGTSGTYGAVPSSGALSIQNFYGTSNYIPVYIENLFSTYLYTGNGSTQTITNGINLSGEGGLVWIKRRDASSAHTWYDTVRGATNFIRSENTDEQSTSASTLTSFNTNGFSIGADLSNFGVNQNGETAVSWTFRKQPKFFDIVTYTGNGASSRSVSHNLGSVPGMVIYKNTTTTSNWIVNHRAGDPGGNYTTTRLNQTSANLGNFGAGNYTSTEFIAANIGTILTGVANDNMNVNGNTYVAYLFAHNAGGFGLTGTDNVISCGSFTTDAGGLATVTLGYEPQWVLVKCTSNTDNWTMLDNMRGWNMTTQDKFLLANSSNEESEANFGNPTATGFDASFGGSRTYIYIAIRRGPMEVPTLGTSVFAPLTYTGNGTSGRYISGAGFPPDLIIQTARSASENREFDDRLRGGGSTAMNALFSNSSNAEAADSGSVQLLNQDGFTVRSFGNGSGVTYIGEAFRRAPGFFDEVCYTGTGSAVQTYSHNLGVAPELMIVKCRNDAGRSWTVYSSALGNGFRITLQQSLQALSTTVWNSTSPTATQFTVTFEPIVGANNFTYVNYLFATCPGVSKVGSFTGTGTTQTINCGFTGGARFVLIKATSTTGDWYVWDSARGIVAGNDPYLTLNTTAAEVTSTDWVDTAASGFELSNSGGNLANSNGVSYIFLAVA